MKNYYRLVITMVALCFLYGCGASIGDVALDGDLASLKTYIEEGEDINELDSYGRTPLIIASYYGYLKMVDYLLKNGAKVNVQDEYGFTALHWGAYYGRYDIVKALVEYGADKTIEDYRGYTAKDYADQYNFEEVSKFLEQGK